MAIYIGWRVEEEEEEACCHDVLIGTACIREMRRK
jgi:hypothetical protein